MTKILIFTGGRADYGLLSPLIEILKKNYSLSLVISNMHLSKLYGGTSKEIKRKNFKSIFYVNNLPKGQENLDILKSISIGIKKYSNCIVKSRPKLAIILGDRYEMLASSISCFFLNIPILHINGGEKTLGSLDDQIRDAITIFSNYHCPPTEKSKKRIQQILQKKHYIINSGALGAYNAYNAINKKKSHFVKKYKIKFKEKNILVTIHPEKNFSKDLREVKIFLNSLIEFSNLNIIFTASNSDSYGKTINNLISKFCKKNKNSIFIKSFGKNDYLSIIRYIDCIVGNSSSGIIEAPILRVPTLNIGNRQKGREFAKSIFQVGFNRNKIVKMLNKIIKINKKNINFQSPYYKGNILKNIFRLINKIIKKNEN